MSHHLIEFLPLDGVVLIILELRAKVGRVLGVVLGSLDDHHHYHYHHHHHHHLDEVLVHDPHQRLVVVETKLVEQRLSDLVDIAHHHTREENLESCGDNFNHYSCH